MKKTKRLIRNFIFFIVLVILTFSIVLKEKGLADILIIIANAKKEYILIAFLMMFFYITLDAINIGRVLKTLHAKSTFWENVKYSLIGFFFSGITPAASGGQPMQIYYMHKDKISAAHATLTLIINLICIQVVTISMAVISAFINVQYLTPGLISLLILGIILNGTALTFLLISILSKKLTKILIRISLKFLRIFKVKNIKEKEKKIKRAFAQYHRSARYIKRNKKIVLKNLLTTYLQFTLFYSVSYFVYRALGFSEYTYARLLTLQSVLYATVSGIPSPGAVGVSEGGYIAIFTKIFTEDKVHSAMLLSRGINFYAFMLISAIVVMIHTLKDNNQQEDAIHDRNKK